MAGAGGPSKPEWGIHHSLAAPGDTEVAGGFAEFGVFLEERLHEAYEDAVLMAAAETAMGEEAFPGSCPFGMEQVMEEGFLP